MLHQKQSEWQLEIPAYGDGVLDPVLYSCGYAYYEGKDKSLMRQINETTAEAFTEYCRMLEEQGYQKTFGNEIDGNLYRAYTAPDGSRWYVYYLTADGKTGTARVIHECAASATLEDFCYTAEGEGEFYAFNLNTEADDTYLIRLSDNKWIVIDGGTTKWKMVDAEGRFADSLYKFMRERSGLKDGDKLVIASWYLTHGHRDHFMAFGAMIERYHENIRLERIIANIPDHDVIDHNSNLSDFRCAMEILQRYFPNVMYLKAHTGMKIQLANVTISVLYTQEDHLDFWIKNKQSFWDKWKFYSSMDKDAPDYEECRQSYKVYDINNTSLNALFSFDGITLLELGDGFRWHELMRPYYSDTTLLADIIKTAHHFNNEETVQSYCELCEYGQPVCLFIASEQIRKEQNEQKMRAALKKDQKLILARCDTIMQFRRSGKEILVCDIPAAYSWRIAAQ